MGTCIVSIFQYIFNKMQRYTVYLYLETALHVSGGTSTHHQVRIQLYLQHRVFVTPLLLSAAIVEELELVWVCTDFNVKVLSCGEITIFIFIYLCITVKQVGMKTVNSFYWFCKNVQLWPRKNTPHICVNDVQKNNGVRSAKQKL